MGRRRSAARVRREKVKEIYEKKLTEKMEGR
jgi:hypothetical protein